MKKAGFLLALICILSLTGCGMVASAEEEILQPDTEENTVSVNFDDVATQSEPTEQFCNHLVQFTESTFTDEEGIESADAIVSYDEETEQYSIELSLKTNGVTRHFIVDEKSILFSTVSTPLRHLHFADRTLLSRKLCSQIKIFRLELCVQ